MGRQVYTMGHDASWQELGMFCRAPLLFIFGLLWILPVPDCLTAAEDASPQSRPAQEPAYFEATLTRQVSLHYLLYLPEAYEGGRRKWPLVLYLHGAGERGSDLEHLKKHGPPKLVAEGKKLPFILVSPQCPDGDIWHADTL